VLDRAPTEAGLGSVARLGDGSLVAVGDGGAIVRLLDLGVQAYLIASTLRCVVAQRLVRKLCTHCRVPYEAAPELLIQFPEAVAQSSEAGVRLYKPGGCTYCGGTGFAGRAAIFEVLAIDDELRRLIKPGVSADVLVDAARRAGVARRPG
jgi:general secretion pathway protein E